MPEATDTLCPKCLTSKCKHARKPDWEASVPVAGGLQVKVQQWGDLTEVGIERDGVNVSTEFPELAMAAHHWAMTAQRGFRGT